MFWFDEEGLYHTAAARYVTLIVQIVLLFLTSVYALAVAFKTGGTGKKRHLAIGLSGLIMLIFISIQIFFPFLPLYAIAYMLGCCLLRTFVIENEKEEYRENLAVALEREKKQVEELNTAWKAAYTDALTGVRSTLAYSEKQADIDKRIAEDSLAELGVAVFDLNDLKKINDNLGHDVGDKYIKEACKLICTVFDHSPVYRIGGDEFVAILEGADYKNRDNLLQLFNRHVQKNIDDGSVIVSVGIAEYIKGRDNSYKRIFERADLGMYEQKKNIKQQHTAL
jgi:diguanylate cyclase (GGDEF)-like protein